MSDEAYKTIIDTQLVLNEDKKAYCEERAVENSSSSELSDFEDEGYTSRISTAYTTSRIDSFVEPPQTTLYDWRRTPRTPQKTTGTPQKTNPRLLLTACSSYHRNMINNIRARTASASSSSRQFLQSSRNSPFTFSASLTAFCFQGEASAASPVRPESFRPCRSFRPLTSPARSYRRPKKIVKLPQLGKCAPMAKTMVKDLDGKFLNKETPRYSERISLRNELKARLKRLKLLLNDDMIDKDYYENIKRLISSEYRTIFEETLDGDEEVFHRNLSSRTFLTKQHGKIIRSRKLKKGE